MNPLVLNNYTPRKSPIIVALDYSNETEVINLIKQLDPNLCKLKVGKELFTACGPQLVEKLIISGFDVFLDLKFHDIPNTVYKACKVAANLGVWMINVHASGGKEMLDMAKLAINESVHKPLLTAVTVLTSLNQESLIQIGIDIPLNQHVLNLAKLAHSCGLDGVVCSALEAKLIKYHTSMDFLTISPGIRLDDTLSDDQKRVVTPIDAINNNVDYLVIGRPITLSPNPNVLLNQILTQICRLG